MTKEKIFKENNSMIKAQLISLSDFIAFHISDYETPMIDFYSVKEEGCLTDFVLFTYTKGNMLDFNPDVDTCLMYWDGKKWCNTNIETRERFAGDHPYFNYNWFKFD